jgi:plastocyanin
MGQRRAAVALVVLTFIAAGCTGGGGKGTSDGVVDQETETTGPTGPQTYTVSMGAPSPDGQHVLVAATFPVKVEVRPGDTVLFENRSTEGPHTVTFGASPLDPDPLPVMTRSGVPNPVVFGPCYSDPAPTADAEACPSPPPATPPAFDGVGYWNSGVIPAFSGSGAPAAVAMKIADDAPVDSFSYSCMLHRYMSGQIEVVEADVDREMPSEVAASIERLRSAALNAAGRLTEPAVPTVGASVVAGWGDKVSAVNRFAPAVTRIKAGETVTWKALSPFEPHTVTFESPFRSPDDAGVFTAGGAKDGSRYSGGFSHSGFIGPEPFGTDSFSLTFTKRGSYPYVCALHPGMAGQVDVVD